MALTTGSQGTSPQPRAEDSTDDTNSESLCENGIASTYMMCIVGTVSF